MGHVNAWMIEQMEKAVAAAAREVQDRNADATSVTVTFAVGRDKDGMIEGKFSVKGSTKKDHDWVPRYLGEQLDLPLNGNGNGTSGNDEEAPPDLSEEEADRLAEEGGEDLDRVAAEEAGRVIAEALLDEERRLDEETLPGPADEDDRINSILDRAVEEMDGATVPDGSGGEMTVSARRTGRTPRKRSPKKDAKKDAVAASAE